MWFFSFLCLCVTGVQLYLGFVTESLGTNEYRN